MIWQNLMREDKGAFTVVRFPMAWSLDELFVSIGDDVRDGLYTLISVNASRFHLEVTCLSRLTSKELRDKR